MRPSKAPGIWGSSRWLEMIYASDKQQVPVQDFPDKTKPDIAYDDGDRPFWEKISVTSCQLAQDAMTAFVPPGRNLTYKVIDREAVRQIEGWYEVGQSINEARQGVRYCRRQYWPAQRILDLITGDEDVSIAGFNPRPTEDDVLDQAYFGMSSSPPDIVESIRANSKGYSTLGFCLWEGDKVIGMIAGNSTRQNYGRDHIAFGLLQKAPSWRDDGEWAVKAIGLPALFATHLVGKSQMMLEGADDPPGFHRIMQRHGFAFTMRSRPEGYGKAGAMIANIADLADCHGIHLPPPMVPKLPIYGQDGRMNLMPSP